jgi:hypothetical protein
MADYFWKVETRVSGGYYIVSEETYASKEGAEASITHALRDVSRAVLYRTGRGTDGPERAEGDE